MQNDIIIKDLIKEIELLKKELASVKLDVVKAAELAEFARGQAYLARNRN